MVAEILDKGKEYGREFVLCVVLLTGGGIGMRMVWDTTNARLGQQDTRIEKNEDFIRTELLSLNRQSLEVTSRATEAMSKATIVMDSAVKALDRNTQAIQEIQ